MTAKELKTELADIFKDGYEYPIGTIGHNKYMRKMKLLDEFAAQLCLEQRKSCANSYSKGKSPINDILNAKEPEL